MYRININKTTDSVHNGNLSTTNIYSGTLSFSLFLYEIEPVHNGNLSITSELFFLEQFFVQANLCTTNFFLYYFCFHRKTLLKGLRNLSFCSKINLFGHLRFCFVIHFSFKFFEKYHSNQILAQKGKRNVLLKKSALKFRDFF
jgi:hypothetical protein